MDRHIETYIQAQLPDYIQADHQTFRKFLEAYYAWMDSADGSNYASAKLLDIADIDDTLDDYVEYFRKQYLRSFPVELALSPDGQPADKALFIKNIKSFYNNRGSEQSYNFLLQMLFNSPASLYLPKEDMMFVSGGNWEKNYTIKTTFSSDDNFDLIGSRLIQRNLTTGEVEAYAVVDQVLKYPAGGLSLTVAEFTCKEVFNPSNFTSGSLVEASTNTGVLIQEKILPIITGLTFGATGSGYALGEKIQFSGGGLGAGGLARVSDVDDNGQITDIDIIDFGVNYTTVPTVGAGDITTVGGTGADISVTVGPISLGEGKYVDQSSFISEKKKRLQDSYYYQPYSYVVKCEVALEKFRDIAKKVIHPAGMNLFSSVLITKKVNTDLDTDSQTRQFANAKSGHFTPYTFGTTANLGFSGHNDSGLTMYPNGYNPGASGAGHCSGDTGGFLIITNHSVGFTLGSFVVGQTASQQASGSSRTGTGGIFDFKILGSISTSSGNQILTFTDVGATSSVESGNTAYLRLSDITSNITGVFSTNTAAVLTASNGHTANVISVNRGNGTVPETGGITHNPTSSVYSLGGISAADSPFLNGAGSTVSPPFEHTVAGATGLMIGFAADHFTIFNHPNLRSDIGVTYTMGSIDINTFIRENTEIRESGFGGIDTTEQSINYPYIGFTG